MHRHSKIDSDNESGVRTILRVLAALFFVTAGTLHFIVPATYERIIPPALPWPRLLVLISGAFEVIGGVGLLLPRVRRVAGWGLIALLAAVFPANVYMATYHEQFAALPISPWMLWARLPLQGVFIVWVWWVSKSSSVGASAG